MCYRFCCFERPTETLTSESNEMMIIFKSNYSYDYLVNQRGFHAVLTAGKLVVHATYQWAVHEHIAGCKLQR